MCFELDSITSLNKALTSKAEEFPIEESSGKAESRPSVDLFATLQERLHEELKKRVSSNNAKKVHVVSYIAPYSTPEEVQFWLNAKGFTARTQQKFQNMGGKEIFDFSKFDLQKELGTDEGHRLFNQVIIQKNICGYKSLRLKELNSVLEARRKKIDPEDDFSDRRDSSDSVATSTDTNGFYTTGEYF